MNNEEIIGEETLEEGTEEVTFNDKRRFNDKGDRIKVEVDAESDPAEGEIVVEDAEEPKSPEVVKLEQALNDITLRCQAAETKLQQVQKRFEEEQANLERETGERRERMKKSLQQRADQSRFDFLAALLPVLDNLDLAIDASAKDSSFEHLLDGVKGTARSFEKALINVGVEPVASVGELFDPELHEAVEMVEVDEEDEGKIIGEHQRGYKFRERLLRPARVSVGNAINSKKAGE